MRFKKAIPFVLAMMMAAPVWARRDPLNNVEIDQLREAAQDPNDRIPLIVKFARARLQSLEQVRSDPKLSAADRADQIHDLLQDFTSIYDELGDNLDMYQDQKADFRKAMHVVIEGDAEFQNRLKTFNDTVTADPAKYGVRDYQFVLQNAIDAVNSGATDHRQVLQEQNELAKDRKKHK